MSKIEWKEITYATTGELISEISNLNQPVIARCSNGVMAIARPQIFITYNGEPILRWEVTSPYYCLKCRSSMFLDLLEKPEEKILSKVTHWAHLPEQPEGPRKQERGPDNYSETMNWKDAYRELYLEKSQVIEKLKVIIKEFEESSRPSSTENN